MPADEFAVLCELEALLMELRNMIIAHQSAIWSSALACCPQQGDRDGPGLSPTLQIRGGLDCSLVSS